MKQKQSEAMGQERRDKLKELEDKVNGIVGFGAVKEYGSKLNDEEIEIIGEYSSLLGGKKEYVQELLGRAGRPFTMDDSTFENKCTLCSSLRNYCCC